MSKYGVSITELKEEKYLVDALREMGYRPEVHHEAVPMNSYYSEQEAKLANIIIRRHELRGACGDIGFARQPDGRLTLSPTNWTPITAMGRDGLGAFSSSTKRSRR